MNLQQAHAYFGQLLASGVNPKLPLVSLVDGEPKEICDVCQLAGNFYADPSPKMSAFRLDNGPMLALIPICEDQSDLLNPAAGASVASHVEIELPVAYDESR